jgi:tRNA pseudouridine38-40 synthase
MDDPTTTTGSGERPARRRVRLRVAYDGTGFHGFAINAGVRTVAGELTRAISTVVREPVEITGAGRTDAGVHGWGQVVHVDLPAGTDAEALVRRINKLCAPDLSVREPIWVADDFDARFSATWREYRYHVWNDPVPNPLVARTAWHVPRPLSMWALRASGDPLLGEHDFASFCRRPDVGPGRPPASLVRRVLGVRWSQPGDAPLLRFEIRATAFCHQMVRSIVGTMVDVGLGRTSAGEVNAILRARDRRVAGAVAPPHGLVLWDVGYEGERWDHGRSVHGWLPRG